MAIRVTCPGCGKGINAADKYAGLRKSCPACGAAIQIPAPAIAAVAAAPSAVAPTYVAPPPVSASPPASNRPAEQTLLKVRPSTFRNRPIGVVLLGFVALIGLLVFLIGLSGEPEASLIGLGVMLGAGGVIAIWHLQSLTTLLTITTTRSILRRGILSKHTREVRHSDVRLLEVSQSFSQRIMRVGTVKIASAAHGEIEIVCPGLANPEHVKETVDGHRH